MWPICGLDSVFAPALHLAETRCSQIICSSLPGLHRCVQWHTACSRCQAISDIITISPSLQAGQGQAWTCCSASSRSKVMAMEQCACSTTSAGRPASGEDGCLPYSMHSGAVGILLPMLISAHSICRTRVAFVYACYKVVQVSLQHAPFCASVSISHACMLLQVRALLQKNNGLTDDAIQTSLWQPHHGELLTTVPTWCPKLCSQD